MSKSDAKIREIAAESAMYVGMAPGWYRIVVTGTAARVPSVANSRMSMFPKRGIEKLMEDAVECFRQGQGTKGMAKLQAARKELRNRRVVNTMNSDHKERLAALTLLWQNVDRRVKVNLPLDARKERWIVWLSLPKVLNRVDSHNIPKGICDWLQEVGVLKNDLNVECLPLRAREVELNEDYLQIGIESWDRARPYMSCLDSVQRMKSLPFLTKQENETLSQQLFKEPSQTPLFLPLT